MVCASSYLSAKYGLIANTPSHEAIRSCAFFMGYQELNESSELEIFDHIQIVNLSKERKKACVNFNLKLLTLLHLP